MEGCLFDGCSNLTSISFPSTLTYVVCGGMNQFYQAPLTSVTFANSTGWRYEDGKQYETIDFSDPAENAKLFRGQRSYKAERQ